MMLLGRQSTIYRSAIYWSNQIVCCNIRYNSDLSPADDMVSSVESAAPTSSRSEQKARHISKAMKAYLEKAKDNKQLMAKEVAQFDLGKHHLANIMGLDKDELTQQDIDKAIEYLLPSGLFSRRARPSMRHPDQIYPKQKEAAFDENGRPYHHLFYMVQSTYYQHLTHVASKCDRLKAYEDAQLRKGITKPAETLILHGTKWVNKDQLSTQLLEEISEDMVNQLVLALEHLVEQPYAYMEKDFIMMFRREMGFETKDETEIPEIKEDESGRKYSEGFGRRKDSNANVRLFANGSGTFNINGKALHHVPKIQSREILLFPFVVVDRLGEFDVEADVTGKVALCDAQCGAVRLATANALCAFLDEQDREKLRLAGLLSRDPRRKERLKYGQRGARRKKTWKKR